MEFLQGKLLIASPRLVDPNFAGTVVLMVQHDKEGALGLILNRPTETSIKSAWEQVGDSPCEADALLHIGGPVEGPLAVVHTQEELSEIEVMPGVYFSVEKQAIEQLVGGNEGPMKFFVGYAGWAAGQLENEMREGSWLTMQATSEQVFEDEDHWAELLKRIIHAAPLPGVRPELIPDDPSVN
jgi:putative transcriptional regulator